MELENDEIINIYPNQFFITSEKSHKLIILIEAITV